MGKKYQYASSAEACEKKGREGRSDHDAVEWFGLAMYWSVLSRCTRAVDQRVSRHPPSFIEQLEATPSTFMKIHRHAAARA
jgi:hypothetical protein